MNRNITSFAVFIFFIIGLYQPVSAADFDHSRFDQVLKTYVNDQGLVDYNGIAGDQSFNSYMESAFQSSFEL